jgi:hypothetical protein
MAVKIEVNQADTKAIKLALAGIKNGAARALSAGVNKAIKTTQVQAVKLIGQDLNLKAARIKEDFKQDKASATKPTGSLIAKGEPVGLINFTAKQTKKGVTSKVKKSSSRYLTTGAYIGKGKNSGNKLHVFRRTYKGPKVPIMPTRSYGALPDKFRRVSRKTGPRIEDIYGDPVIYDKVQKIAVDALAFNIGVEVASLLRRFG